MENINLTGQVALVTGGGRGLGRGMAQSLAAAGAAVALVGRAQAHLNETADLIRQAGGRAFAVSADVSDRTAVENMVPLVENELGPVDILVNNAGVMSTPGPIWEADPENWHSVMDINVYGAFLCTRYILPGMVKRRSGRIINVASGAALGMVAYGHAYCISKAALARLTEAIVTDAAQHGISAFVIDPGTVRTDMANYLLESEEGQTYLPWFRVNVLEEKMDVPAELSANLVTRLASGEADVLNGRFISVGDDLDHLIAQAESIQQNDLLTLRLGTLPA
jgi:NAD(P)-dependent dehydrogenase (short-subunit alcohol dehydrogenase family)